MTAATSAATSAASAATPSTAATSGAPVLTPSEVVYLCADAFTAPADAGTEVLRAPGTHVDGAALARAALLGAVLGSEAAGALRLELGTQKRWFGLKTARVLYLVPTGRTVEWPSAGLEAQVLHVATTKAPENKHDAEAVLCAVLTMDENPEAALVTEIVGDLVERGLVVQTQVPGKKLLKVFSTTETHRALTDAGRAALAQVDPGALQRLIQASAARRPELHALLTAAVKDAFHRNTRREAPDMDRFGGSD